MPEKYQTPPTHESNIRFIIYAPRDECVIAVSRLSRLTAAPTQLRRAPVVILKNDAQGLQAMPCDDRHDAAFSRADTIVSTP